MSWGNSQEFMFTCLLYVLGLGNILRFPELAYNNGGGAFLMVYLLCLLLIGIPLFYLEIAFGQFTSLGSIAQWRVSPLFKGVGIGVIISNSLSSLSYNLTTSWAVYYFFASMKESLPWSQCWSTDLSSEMSCKGYNKTDNLFHNVYEKDEKVIDSNFSSTSSNHSGLVASGFEGDVQDPLSAIYAAENHFYYDYLKMSPSVGVFGYPQWKLCLSLLLTWILVYVILMKNIKSVGKVSLALIPVCVIILLAFLIQSFVLDKTGSSLGVKYLITPQWKYLAKGSTWYAAGSQVLFSLSLMQGGLTILATYNRFTHNVLRAAVLIPVIDTLLSLLASVTLFSVLGVLAHHQQVNISQVLGGSTGTVFVAFTKAASMMPTPQLWNVLFFLVLVTMGIGSQYVSIEAVVSAIIDEYPVRLSKKRLTVIGVVCSAMFVLSLPLTCNGGIYLQEVLNRFAGANAVMFLALVYNIALVWVYGIDKLLLDIKAMMGAEPTRGWRWLWKFITPASLLMLFVLSFIFQSPPKVTAHFIDYTLPVWADVIGWLIFTVQIIPIFISSVTLYITTPTAPIGKKLRRLSRPSCLWESTINDETIESSSDLTDGPRQVSRRVFAKNSSLKTGKDIGGLDSIFSATVGNNVLVKMATNLGSNLPASKPATDSSKRIKRASSADLLAKRMESSDGGPIMFVEDGETYMLVPKRKTRPLSVDKSTQTARNCGPYRSHGNNNNKQNGRSQLNCGSDCTGIEIRISQNNE